MNQIEQIKKELAEITVWPWWVWHNPNYEIERVRGKEDINVCKIDRGSSFNAYFIAQSPERIALLLEYIEAIEEYFYTPLDDLKTLGQRQRLLAACRKLGLEP